MHVENALIVGAGPIGIATALSARRAGVDPLLVDAGAIVDAIRRYPVGMRFFSGPELLEIGRHPFVCAGEKPTREEAMKYYRGVVRTEGLRVRTYARLHSLEGSAGQFRATLRTSEGDETIVARCVVLATGYFDQPRRLDVPGEDLPHVSHYFDEPHSYYQRDVVVVGGGNSAVEAALELMRAGANVTLVHRREHVKPTVKYWMRPDVENRVKAGEIAAHFDSTVTRIDEQAVHVETPAGAVAVPAHRVFLLTGWQPDFDFFRRLGIRLADETLEPALDPDTYETNVRGLFMVGSITRGRAVSQIFIENGRFDGDRVFPAPTRA